MGCSQLQAFRAKWQYRQRRLAVGEFVHIGGGHWRDLRGLTQRVTGKDRIGADGAHRLPDIAAI